VLAYLLRRGAPTGPEGQSRDRIDAFVEVDPRNPEDVKRTIQDCEVACIGFNVPACLLAELEDPMRQFQDYPGPA
jgi:hypothetical protein